MDGYEATRMVFSRIQSIDPENASKIMGLLLIQDHGEKEMIRLAFGPEALLHSVILKSRKDLGLPSNSPSSPSTPSSPSPFLSTNPIAIARQNSRLSSACGGGVSFSPPLANVSSPSSWAALSDSLQRREELVDSNGFGGVQSGSSSSIYGNGSSDSMIDEFQLQDQLSFLNDCSPPLGPNNAELLCPQSDMLSSPTGWGSSVHRRSCSVSDVCLGSEDPSSGIGWKPCLYYARGFCKNGNSCRFLHGGGLGDSAAAVLMGGPDGGSPVVGSPSKVDLMGQCHELLRSKSAQQQRLAAASQLMGGSSTAFPYSPKSLNLLLQHQQNDAQRAAAALMMGEDIYNKYGRSRLERNDFSMNGMTSPASRQIYLTFPADSTFREDDVSNYFSIYGPVQDVRIPYQQKRMFGFVTFVYPETVKLILAKGNPHFVCDARVLVKPYKEKGKVPDKKQQQQAMERGEFSPCGTPTGLDSRAGPFDLHLGTRSFYNSQDMMWRRKLEEQADLQQALELQSQRLMNLQLLDVKKHHHHRALSTGSPIPSPTQASNLFNQTFVLPSISSSPGFQEENGSIPASAIPGTNDNQPIHPIVTSGTGNDPICNDKNGSDKESSNNEDGDLPESLEHNLPDSPFASPAPTNASSDYNSAFSSMVNEVDRKEASSASSPALTNNNMASPSLVPAAAAVDMASFKSFNCQMPRFSSGHGAIGMYAGASGPTYPVGV
ncbi:zinc finger CCCH domain-containing protein 53 isoform X2 [Punica granatum]|uniref:Uncharacterized protein n=2 Tax=Punica granatum TaxID=22663 RepID=A0A218X090_PUNGR|nr:zinc finger CCCH domain-containing protein 53 isoform X2 [Punica granatum]OWM78417.1 hypothetical protein CDL15_Pgr016141 [Punica granatum]PKI62975.1 hypothetical protein CRG98_016614 [Punica granatum]